MLALCSSMAVVMPPPSRGCCAHDHDCAEEECGGKWSLYKYIDTLHVRSWRAQGGQRGRPAVLSLGPLTFRRTTPPGALSE